MTEEVLCKQCQRSVARGDGLCDDCGDRNFLVIHTAKDGTVSSLIFRHAPSIRLIMEAMLEGGFIDDNTAAWQCTVLYHETDTLFAQAIDFSEGRGGIELPKLRYKALN